MFTSRLAIVLSLASLVLPGSSKAVGPAKPWSWVWYPGQWRRAPGKYFGRLTFRIDGDVKIAYVFFTGDNFTTLYLNGTRIAGSGDWYTLKPVTIKTIKPLLRRGDNVLAAYVKNDDYEGGFALKGMILQADGKRILLDSNERWRCTNKLIKGWEKPGFDDSRWVASECIGTPPAGPWGSPTLPPSRHVLGELDVADPVSEKQFGYMGRGELVTTTLSYADGTRLTDTGRRLQGPESFTVKLTSSGYLLLRRRLAAGQCGDLRVAVDGKDAGLWHSDEPPTGRWSDAYFVVPNELTAGKRRVKITLTAVATGKYVAYRYDLLTSFEWYMFDAGAAGSLCRSELGEAFRAALGDAVTAFRYGLALEGEHRWSEAALAYRRCATLAAGSDLGQSACRGARLAEAMSARRNLRGDGTRLFEIGMYLKLNGFYNKAAEVLREAIEVRPTADGYDQLGEAMLFAGRPVQECIKVWKTGLRKFPPKDTNRWRCIIALRPTPQQLSLVPAQKRQLQTMLDMIYLSSRGRMSLDAKMLVNPPPRERLFSDGELDSLITVAGGAGGGVTLGPDVNYGHSGWSGFGFVTVWDVAWHEWIHQFECGLASSNNGPGWGGCHGSTHYGYRPPWWNWYRVAMRYYVRPGNYQRVCIADHVDVPYADKWLVKGQFADPDVSPAWICYPHKRSGNKLAWNVRKSFTLRELPAKATLAATADNRCVAYVNAHRVSMNNSWMAAPTVDITNFLHKGTNAIALAALNEDHIGAVLAYVSIQPKSGGRLVFATDGSWKAKLSSAEEFQRLCSDPTPPAWAKPCFDDSSWSESELIGRYPCPPWKRIRIELPDTLMSTDFVGPSANAPSVADGWKAVSLTSKMAQIAQVAPVSSKVHRSLTYAFTYVYAPSDMRVQMSLGASWRTFVTLNGELLCEHKGHNLPTLPHVFPIYLKKGWNRLLLRLEAFDGTGLFWVKVYRPDGKSIEGLKYANEKPASGIVPDQRTLPVFDPRHPRRYRWADVAEDPYTLMPRLTAADLAELTGYKGLELHGGNNFLFVDLKTASVPAGYMPLSRYAGGEREVNNALTWDFEPLAVVRYSQRDEMRDLLLVKPDALELVFQTHLLKLSSPADTPGDNLLGWVLVDGRLCVVADCRLPIRLPRRTLDLFAVD